MNSEEISRLFPIEIRRALSKIAVDWEGIYEIHLRMGRPVILVTEKGEHYLSRNGGFTSKAREAYAVGEKEIQETLEYAAGYSLYAYAEEIRQGFLTIQGGHRVGIAGHAVMENGNVQTLTQISSLNVRLAQEKKGCADKVMSWIRKGKEVYNSLIISPPRGGKTTLLRDVIRQLSDGNSLYPGMTVGIVDERGELAGCCRGVPQKDIGMRTDVLDACPKAEGMMMLVRSMSPQIVAVDELGNYEDIHAIETVLHCGCCLLATMHGSSVDDIKRKPLMDQLMREGVFERFLVLESGEKAGVVQGIYDENGRNLYVRNC